MPAAAAAADFVPEHDKKKLERLIKQCRVQSIWVLGLPPIFDPNLISWLEAVHGLYEGNGVYSTYISVDGIKEFPHCYSSLGYFCLTFYQDLVFTHPFLYGRWSPIHHFKRSQFSTMCGGANRVIQDNPISCYILRRLAFSVWFTLSPFAELCG